MKRNEVLVGESYYCKVSGHLCVIKIVADRGYQPNFKGHEIHRGWTGKNLTTGREVHVRSALRLRGLAHSGSLPPGRTPPQSSEAASAV